MTLVDTPAWVEYDRATGSAVDHRITALISDEGAVGVTESVVMEVLAGARTEARELDLRRLLLRFELLRTGNATCGAVGIRRLATCSTMREAPRQRTAVAALRELAAIARSITGFRSRMR